MTDDLNIIILTCPEFSMTAILDIFTAKSTEIKNNEKL